MNRFRNYLLTVALAGTMIGGGAVIGTAAAQAACTSVSVTNTYSGTGAHNGYKIVGRNYCATDVFRADIAWAADTSCETIVRNGSHTWYVGLQRGDVRGLVAC
ncbi:hypothetical protein DQ239_10800 [Blastococcus sp. TF02-09]|uniref:hypothetical protein n=1 Tax=Blastococcus sp. TF02-09 TaxID=2250576 RepID=UPI000DEA64C4|nr:hypothetical protein [Blastococcus sp. TF02-9]RBY77372.1 hypothetical protein DQ239_10800 [Blastococcus sp. TF02-9]